LAQVFEGVLLPVGCLAQFAFCLVYHSLTMQSIALALACLACVGQARRVLHSTGEKSLEAVSSHALAELSSESEEKGNFKVVVCGGAGGIGQPLAMLMTMNPNVAEVVVYDLTISAIPAAGVAADLSHLDKKAAVTSSVKSLEEKAIDVLGDAFAGASLVLVPAGLPRKPGQTRDDLFKVNAGIAKEVVEAAAKYCPDAILALIVNPVNSIVPAMAELYKKKGLDPHKIVGVTSLDVVRANKFVAEIVGVNPADVAVPVIGGHAGVTIMPVFSQDQYAKTIPADQIPALDEHVQNAGTDVVNAKGGKGSATLSMAYAGARLGSAVLAGLAGSPTKECAYVMSDVVEGLPYFTSYVTFGTKGVETVHPIGELNKYEQERLEEAKAALKKEIQSGLDYAENNTLA